MKIDAEKLEGENARLPKVFEAAAVALASAELDSTEKEGRLRDSRELRDSYLRAAEDWAKKVKALRAMQGNSGQVGKIWYSNYNFPLFIIFSLTKQRLLKPTNCLLNIFYLLVQFFLPTVFFQL